MASKQKAKASVELGVANEEVPASEPVVEEASEPVVEEAASAPQLAVGYKVVSKSPTGFYRCGRKFTREATVFAPGELSEGELERLKAEPHLVVKEVVIEAKLN